MGADGGDAERAYERTREEFVARRVVDEAEDVLGRAWVAELADMRLAALGLIAAARVSASVAREELRKAQRGSEPAKVARAHARLAALEEDSAANTEHARYLLARVDAELESAAVAELRRSRRAESDAVRLRRAWAAVQRPN